MSRIVVDLDIIKKNGVWYIKGLDMKGEEVWEEVKNGEYDDGMLERLSDDE